MNKNITNFEAIKKNIEHSEIIKKRLKSIKWYEFHKKIKYLIIKKRIDSYYYKLCDNFLFEIANKKTTSKKEQKKIHQNIIKIIDSLYK